MIVTRNEENCSILARYRAGDKKALDELCEKNKNLVVAVAKKYCDNFQDLEDVINEAWLGFLIAVKEYDAVKNAAFSLFAFVKIRQHLGMDMRSNNRVKRKMPGAPLELEDTIAIEPDFDSMTRQELRDAIGILSSEERQVIESIYFNEESQIAVGEQMGLSRQRVQRLQTNALERLREELSG